MADNKEKKYVSDNAQLMAEWDWEKNNELGFDPHKLTCGSDKKIWWKCKKGHSWEAKINNISNGKGCPICANRTVLKGYNDILTVNSNLAKEWNFEKNGNLIPEDFTVNSNKTVWWKCSKGHEWTSTICNRNKGRGCPYCHNKKILIGYNDLKSINPKLAAEWNYSKNDNLTPMDVMPYSDKKVWWQCSKGHEWQATIANRNGGTGCPYCSNNKVLSGYNDLQTLNPILAAEWNYEKNGSLIPSNILPNSSKKVWWQCSKGHEWESTISNRSLGRGCPICSSEQKTSFPEYAIEFYLKKYGLNTIHSYKDNGYELDIYIPSKKIAIEYDGYYWHKNKTAQDINKNLKCEKDGILLYRIREGLLPLNSSSIDYVIQQGEDNLSQTIKMLLMEIIGIDVDVNLNNDTIAIENLREHSKKENSIFFLNPNIASEWNHNKNAKLKPEFFTPNSSKKIWWQCYLGHEWKSTIAHRNSGKGCPYCSGKKVLKGYNDLQSVNKTIASEWNYDKNNNFTPEQFTVGSGKKVWWKCSLGHEWQSSIYSRNSGSSCPYCAGQKVLIGYNDLETINPTLAKEWNYEQNGNFKPEHFTSGSGKKVWWKCPKGHEWEATIANRNRGKGCPECAREKRKNKTE